MPKCTIQTEAGPVCQAYALKGTRRCFVHSYTPKLDAALRKGAQLTNARRKLARAKTTAIEQFGLDPSAAEQLATVGDLKRWPPYVASLLITGKVTPAGGQALLAAGRLARDVMSLTAELRLAEMLEDQGGNR